MLPLMFRMPKLLMTLPMTLLILPSLLACGSAMAAERSLRIGGFVVAPMIMGEGNTPIHGALPAYLQKQVATPTGIRLDFSPPMSFPRSKQAVQDGSVDVILIMGGSGQGGPARRANWAWLQPQSVLAVRASENWPAIDALAQLAGKHIGWVGGSNLPPELLGVPIHWQPMYGQNWQTLNLRKLQLGRLDAVFFQNPYSPAYWARQEKIAIRLLPLPLPLQRFEFGYSKRADPALIAEFDQAAAKAFADEQFLRFMADYMARLPE